MTRSSTARAPGPASSASAEGPRASRIAFLGSAMVTTEVGEAVLVNVLCWPTLPNGWVDLTRALRSIGADRGKDPGAKIIRTDKAPSWISACAPQLAAPFGATATAEDHSVAALLMRTSMQVALSVVDLRAGKHRIKSADMHQRALSQCLEIYNESAQVRMREPCTLMLSRSQTAAIDQQQVEALAKCRAQMPGAPWLEQMQLQFWSEALEPIPLELSQLMAAAAARYVLDDDASLPLVDAMITKLVHNPLQRMHPAGRRRK